MTVKNPNPGVYRELFLQAAEIVIRGQVVSRPQLQKKLRCKQGVATLLVDFLQDAEVVTTLRADGTRNVRVPLTELAATLALLAQDPTTPRPS